MGRGGPSKARPPKQRSRRRDDDNLGMQPEDFVDEIDDFHNKREKISLDPTKDLEDLDELEDDEVPVMDLQEGDDDDDDDDMDDEELTGLAAKLVRQSKIMKQRAGMENDDEEEEEEEEKEKTAWGKGKRIYYSADNVEYELQSSDEEAPAEEEAEALRLQKEMAASLRPEDYDVSDTESDDDSEKEETFEDGRGKDKPGKTTLRGLGGSADEENKMVTVEAVKKDISALSKEEQMELLMSDAPELVALVTELRDGLNELHTKIQPVMDKVKDGLQATKEGMNYLEVKHVLLLSYCQSIIFYLLMKAEARSVRDHPVIARLVELKMLLQKLSPIDKKLQHQLERLLKDVQTPAAPHSTVQVNESNLSSATLKFDQDAEVIVGAESKKMLQERARLDACAQKNANLVVHVPVSKAGHKKVKQLKRPRNGLKDILDDLEDDVGDMEGLVLSKSNLISAVGRPRTLSQVIAEAGRPSKKPKAVSGDADLPVREDLGERRRNYEIQQAAKASVTNDTDDSDGKAEGNGQDEDKDPEEDDFYMQAKQLKEAKQAAKAAKYSRTLISPVEELDADGKRQITYQMEKNRGLTPYRKKATKNPRKKYKLKHEKAIIRRKGQVREVRRPTSASYGGESTGIRTNLSRSVRFKN
ncbi:unnamed protein product [Sphagnum troendelagicum]|uniref:Sas10 C-terminal domain-containing protein n=1 Tax=Sphagnum troendelagicum TaxID=128251 RepID=A0ABP0UGJ6_9BRYO